MESIESDCNLDPKNGEPVCTGTEIENVQALEYACIEKGSTAVNFAYGSNRQRYKEVRCSGGSLQSHRLTVNRYFEKLIHC